MLPPLLQNPDTRKQLLEYVEQGCDSFDTYKEQCKQYVEIYGQLAIDTLITYLQPEPLCTQMGWCDTAVAA